MLTIDISPARSENSLTFAFLKTICVSFVKKVHKTRSTYNKSWFKRKLTKFKAPEVPEK